MEWRAVKSRWNGEFMDEEIAVYLGMEVTGRCCGGGDGGGAGNRGGDR
jgi:hypothetical protein